MTRRRTSAAVRACPPSAFPSPFPSCSPPVPRAATALAARGHEARPENFRALVRAGDDVLPVYLIQERLGGMPRSTLAQHLQALVHAGLVAQHEVGAEVVSRAEREAIRDLVAYLTAECCADVEGSAPGAAAAPSRGPPPARRTPTR